MKLIVKHITFTSFLYFSILFFVINPLQAATTTITAYDSANQAAMDNLQSQINTNQTLLRLKRLSDLTRGMADTNAATVHAGSLMSFQNYDSFAISAGYLFGYQLPSLSNNKDQAIENDVLNEGDVYAGFSAELAWVNVGFNASFITEGLYLNAKYGGIDTDFDDSEGFIKSKLYGFGVNYTIINKKDILGGFASWRGVSFGTGFYYHKTEIEYEMDFEVDTPYVEGGFSYDMKPRVNTQMYTVTIPFEVVTSYQLLWILNLSAGAGVDFNTGNADLKLSDKITDAAGTPVADLEFNGTNVSGKSPTTFRPRLMAGMGFNLGPAKLDIPFTYYVPSGWTIGVTIAVVW